VSTSTLHRALDNEIALLSRFIAALESEASVLTSAEGVEALNASTTLKTQLAEQLGQAGNERDNELRQLGLEQGKMGLDAAAQTDSGLRASLDNMLALAARARQLNEANGQIIDAFLKYNQQALDTLGALAGIGGVYDASGRTKNVAGGKKGIRAG